MSELLSLVLQLIACPSITPQDAGCQAILAERLNKAGFNVETLQFGDVTNLWAKYGNKPPLIVFAGHTDVVPPGSETSWANPPFQGTIKEGSVYGRGAADMKGALAAMVLASEKWVAKHPKFNGSLAFLITSDEEGPSINGTKKVLEELERRGEKIDYAVVGEASSIEQAGDQIRVGRRGSLHGKLIIFGKQGHVAYPNLILNPIHKSLAALNELAHTKWDEGNEQFPPTSFQITNITAGTGATNVVPGNLTILFNFRFGTASSIKNLQTRTQAILDKVDSKYDLIWSIGAEPFLSSQGKLVYLVQQAVKNVAGITPRLSTGGGTSDGRYLAAKGAEVVELGVTSATAHQVNEHVKIEEIEQLEKYYFRLLTILLIEQSTQNIAE